MKYTLYHFSRIQGGWSNQGAVAFAATKREAKRAERVIDQKGYRRSDDDVYCWQLSTDAEVKSVGCGLGGSFPLASAV